MAGTGSTADDVYRWVVLAASAVRFARETPAADAARRAQQQLVAELEKVRERGDVGEIVAAERDVLVHESKEFVNDDAMRASLGNALVEIEDAAVMLRCVRDPKRYMREVDATHRHRKHRDGVLPRDDARMFFAAQNRRLGDLRKARGTDEEKEVLRARQRNILRAERLYKALQRGALGIEGRGR